MHTDTINIPVSDSIGSVNGEVVRGDTADCLFVFAHGAGAGMGHPFMVRLAAALAERNIATLRYNFPYMQKGSRRPDPPAVAERTAIRAIAVGRELFPDILLLAGGKSFGGRMTSQALSRKDAPRVHGLVFTGFPLHAAGKPATERALHLKGVGLPMLFLQGTRDALANISLMEEICADLPAAVLKKFEGADHSFKAGKQDLIPALAAEIQNWSRQLALQ